MNLDFMDLIHDKVFNLFQNLSKCFSKLIGRLSKFGGVSTSPLIAYFKMEQKYSFTCLLNKQWPTIRF